ncbi:ATP-binding protein [Ruegeria jejuensis]|uniref:ATP-binding protein n=1 Tax=Ruegeria jejuensis TaxID=3233338 RepID=UPI00355ADBD6
MTNNTQITDTSSPRLGERRLVSVLFTDMVGYTPIVEKLGAETTAHFTSMIYGMLSGVIEEHGGVIRGFAGDSIMAVFGIPDALEDAGLRACKAAMAIQALFTASEDDIEKRFGVRPIMRVGVSSGSVVMAAVEGADGQMTAVGNSVNLAARIQSLAPEGGCLICDTTRALVEWLVDLSFEGEHTIKGVAKQQKLWQLQSIREGATRFDASLARGLSQYVGRDAELSALSEALDQTRDGLRVIDLVAEPGLGKTRLVVEFLDRAKAKETVILTGQCTTDGQQVPFLPFLEVVRGSFGINQDDEPEEIERKLQAGLQHAGQDTLENLGLLMNLLGLKPPEGTLDGLDGVLIGLRTRDLLPALLKAQCQMGRVVLLVEDTHWIDGASETMMSKLVDGGDLDNLLILNTRRPEYTPEWKDNPSVSTLKLKPLTEGDIHHLVQSRLKVDTLPDALIKEVVDRSGGNPLFGEEILSFLTEKGALRVEEGQVVFENQPGGDELPASMQSLLSARIEQLQPKDRALLQAAAAIGRGFDPGLLSMVVEQPDETGAALQRLQALDIVFRKAESSDYMFKHVLLRETVYNSLVANRRSELHLAIAEALEKRNSNRLPEAAETLAHHYMQTPRTDLAFEYSALAGAKSLGVFSHDQANQYFADALALYEQDPTCASDDAFANFLANYALCSNISLDVTTMIELAPRVRPILNEMGENGDHVLFLHHYVSCLVCNSQFLEALSVQRELTEMAKRVGDPKSVAYAMVNELSVGIYCAPLSNAEFAARTAEIEAALTKFDDAYLQNFYFATLGWNELTRGRVIKARETAARMVADGEKNNDPRALGYGTAMKALIAVVTDDHQSALELSEEALRLSRAEFEKAIAESSRVAALVPLERPGAREAVQGYVDMCEANGWLLFAGVPQTMLGVALAMEGRVSEGLQQIKATIENREAEGAQIAADWNRLLLSEVYLLILTGEGGASFGVLMRNFRTLAGIILFGKKRIISLIEKLRTNTQFDPDGHHFARGEMILGLLYKLKKKNEQAVGHLMTAHRLIEPTGASPMLTRIEDALQELGAWTGPRPST